MNQDIQQSKFTKLLQQLCGLGGISGQEQAVCRAIVELLKREGGEVNVDQFGNIAAIRRGRGQAPSLMLVAHLDEVGGIVSQICANGLLRFQTVGLVSMATLPSMRVRVNGLPGVVGAPPAHMEAKNAPGMHLFIDVGAESAADARAMGVEIGQQITFDTPFTPMGAHRVCSHAIDDRVGCAILLQLYEALTSPPEGDVIVAFSVREETSMSGAGMLVERYRPDCVIAVDTVPMNVLWDGDAVISIGKGPVFQLMEGVMSAFVGNSVHPKIKQALIDTAEKNGIPYQLCAEVGNWTTDGAILHRANGGTPTGYVSIARRYAHSASEVMDLRDPIYALQLLQALAGCMHEWTLDFI